VRFAHGPGVYVSWTPGATKMMRNGSLGAIFDWL
jgi:hypothetical protein